MGLYSITIINKRLLLDCLEKNSEIFQRELGPQFSPQQFLTQIEQEKSLHRPLQNHEGLLGILLGYGIESSMHYHEREIALKSQLPFEKILEGVDQENSGFIQPVQFVGNPQSSEVQEITTKNRHHQKQLHQIFSKRKFTHIALEKLTTSN